MRRLIAIVVVVLVVGGVYVYVYPESVARLQGWLAGRGVVEPERSVLYRWRDADGAWQISDAPPPPGTEHERLEYDPDANVLPVPGQERDGR